MNDEKIALGSLALDLKRVSIGYSRQSNLMANRFCHEALARKEEINTKNIKPYLEKILINLPKILAQKDKLKLAEDAAMYSTIIQNYVLFIN